MPRLNIETKIWSDPRFQKLISIIGDRHKAIGILVDLWSMAINHWIPNKEPIPMKIFKQSQAPLEALLECGLAEKNGSGVYAKGSEEAFAWLMQKREAGRLGGKKRAANLLQKHKFQLNNDKLPSQNTNKIEPKMTDSNSSNNTDTCSASNPLTPTLTPTPTLTLNSSFITSKEVTHSDPQQNISNPSGATKRKKKATKGVKQEKEKSGETNDTWFAYEEAFLERYGTVPARNVTVNSQLKKFMQRIGERNAPHIARFYVSHNDYFYCKKMHPVGIMLSDSEKLYAEWKTGKQITSSQAKNLEKESNLKSQLQRIEDGEI